MRRNQPAGIRSREKVFRVADRTKRYKTLQEKGFSLLPDWKLNLSLAGFCRFVLTSPRVYWIKLSKLSEFPKIKGLGLDDFLFFFPSMTLRRGSLPCSMQNPNCWHGVHITHLLKTCKKPTGSFVFAINCMQNSKIEFMCSFLNIKKGLQM